VEKYIRYCRQCVYPETKPDLQIDEEGVCSACRYFNKRPQIDWQDRQQAFLKLVEQYRSKDGLNYDCIVPVSGGKDSTCQVLTLKKMGLNPLCVTATTCQLSDIGRRNIENLKSIGVDYIEYSTNPQVRRKLNRIGLVEVGDISWPEHVSIFTVPVRIAVQLNISLLIWGENPQHEYGGPATNANDRVLDRRWLEEFGGLLGLRVSDLVGQQELRAQDLILFTYPSDADLQRVRVTGLFLGYFFPWDGYANALQAQAHGFETLPTAIEGSLVNYENLDNYQTGIHDYFKFLKYGFCRVSDLASMHIRRGRLRRDDAMEIVRQRDGKFPWTYLGYPIEKVMEHIDMSMEEFIAVCDRFTNKRLFKCDSRGELIKDRHGNLTKINYDNVEASRSAR
jgi:N-acetyl sugar amidotransferase